MQSSRARLVALVGTALVVGYATLGTIQVLVLNPRAAVPGSTLAEIHAGLDRAGESFSPVPIVVWSLVGVVIAIVLLVAAFRTEELTVGHVVIEYSLVLVGGAPTLWTASFGPKLHLADGFGITGADHSPWAVPLYLLSLVALVTAVVTAALAIRAAYTGRRMRPAAD